MACPAIKAGDLRHRIAIQSHSTVQDVAGQEVKTWATDITVSARVEPLKGKERFEAQQVAPEVTHKITMRGGVTVTAENRILFKTRIFNISSVIDVDERGILTEIICIESPDP